MKPMLRLMRRLKTASLGVGPRSIFLIATNVSCAGLKPFPTKTLLEFDPKEPICAEYRIVDEENLKYEWVKDIPFKQCPAIFGFSSRDIPKVLDWGQDAKTYAREHCQ